jgi:hypothetical protein
MDRNIPIAAVAVLVALLPALAVAQAPPQSKSPAAPEKEVRDPDACAHSTVGEGTGVEVKKPDDKSLSDKLAQSKGVICPPDQVDPAMNRPAPGGGTMPVIPPPGSPGGDPNVQPK